MKKFFTSLLAITFSLSTWAQELPQPSPSAMVKQRVGLTDVTIEYSRPAMRGRVIFGGLVPYNELWRTGANKATSLTFSTPVYMNNNTIEPGTYSLFTIPNEGEWQFILNANTELWGTQGFNSDDNILAFTVPVNKHEAQESMSISIENISDNSADIVIKWENVSVSIPFEVKTSEQAMVNINMALEENPEDWRVYRNAANYYYSHDIDLPQALQYMERSLELNNENWYSHFLYAEMLAKNSQNHEAEDEAKEALELGRKSAEAAGTSFEYSGLIETFIESLDEK